MSEDTKTKNKKERVITFVYSSKAEPGVSVVTHRTSQPSLSLAFKECVASMTGVDASMLVIEKAFQGECKVLKEELRKPTYKEMEAANIEMKKALEALNK